MSTQYNVVGNAETSTFRGHRSHRRWAIGLAVFTAALSTTVHSQVILGPPILLGHPAGVSLGQGGVTIARATNGITLAVWSDNRTGDHDVYGVLLNPAGALIGPAAGFKIAGTPGTNEGDPRVTVCGNTFLVVWGNGIGDSDTTDLFATRVSTTGTILSPATIVITTQPGVQHNQRQPASDGVDTFLVPFRTASDSIYGGINTMRVSASTGATLDPPGGAVLAMGINAERLKKNASISFGAGMFFVTWDDERLRAQYPGEGIDIFGAFVDPLTGGIIGQPFPTTQAFSCQEGSRSSFDGANFFVVHNDERITNCVTADVYGERVTPTGQVLDQVDPTGMVGGLEIASDPYGYPNSVQGASNISASGCTRLVTYVDAGINPPQVALRLRRLNPDGTIEGGQSATQPGQLIAKGALSTGTSARVEIATLGPSTHLLAYALDNRPAVRTARFSSPIVSVIAASKLNGPRGVAVDTAGRIHVAETNNDRVQVFDRTGMFLFTFGTFGAGNGQFSTPFGIALDALGNIYVMDSNNDRVQVFNSAGVFKFKFGASGTGNGQFRYPLGLAIGPTGNIYVADTGNNRVQVFSSAGLFKFKFGTPGVGLGQFRAARAVAIAPSGKIYVADRDNHRVQVFSSTGLPQSQITASFKYPRGVALDHTGRLFVADSANNRVVVFNTQGQFHTAFGTLGTGLGQFNFSPGVAVDAQDRVHVVDTYNNRIQVFGCVP